MTTSWNISGNLPWLALSCALLAGCAGGPTPAPGTAGTRPPTTWPEQSSATSPRLLARLKNYYEEWVGVPYRYGGTTKHGIDCSAFVQQTLAVTRGLHLPRTTLWQSRRGHRIPVDRLHIGDLVFFRVGKGRHVGIYIGQGRFMHASSSVGVTVSNMNNVYWRRHFWQARRVP